MAENTTNPEEEVTLADLAKLCRNRADAYSLLSRLFKREVDEKLYAELKEMRFPARTGSEKLDRGYRAMTQYLGAAHDDVITELAVDYVHAFLGSGIDAYSAAYPYESVYTSEKRLLMQEARTEVLAVYRSQGLDKPKDWNDPEDHLALELGFMQIMSNRAARALDDGDEDKAAELLTVQRNFMTDHLLSWVPVMTRDMRKFAQTGFYQALADIVDGYLETDAAMLAGLLGEEQAAA